MLSFFFNRFSKIVYVMEIIGVPLVGLAAVHVFGGQGGAGAFVLMLIVLVEFVFIRICAIVHWYKGVPRGSGIELHFRKMVVATSYAMALLGVALLFAPPIVPLVIVALIFGIIAHINAILLYFHFHDKNTLPVNCYTGGKNE